MATIILMSFFSWIGAIILFIAIFSVSTSRFVGFLGSEIVNLFTNSNSKLVLILKRNGIISDFGIRGLFYKLFVPLEPSKIQQLNILRFNNFKTEFIGDNPNVKYLTVVPCKSNDLLILLNGKPWMDFYSSDIMSYTYGNKTESLLKKLNTDVLLQKLNKL